MAITEQHRTSKPFPWKCGECRERAVQPATIPYTTNIEHDGRSYVVSIPDLEVARCDKCGEIVLSDNANRRISEAFRKQIGLLNPAQIRTRRERLRLTQKQLANQLGIAEATLSRWETGAQIQQRALDRLMRLFFGSEQVRDLLADESRLAALGTTEAISTTSNTTARVDFGAFRRVVENALATINESFCANNERSSSDPMLPRLQERKKYIAFLQSTLMQRIVAERTSQEMARSNMESLDTLWNRQLVDSANLGRWFVAPLSHQGPRDPERACWLTQIADILDQLPEKQEASAYRSLLNLLKSMSAVEDQTLKSP